MVPARRRNRQPAGPSPAAPATPRSQPSATPGAIDTDLARFNQALRDSEARAKQAEAAARRARADAQAAADRAQAHERALTEARRALQRAIDDVRRATQAGRGRAEADAAWRAAKAEVIRLETGEAPAWAPNPPPAEAPVHDDDSRSDTDPATE